MRPIDVRWLLALVGVGVLLVAVTTVGLRLRSGSTADPPPTAGASSAGPVGGPVCGQPSLRSPYGYSGAAGPYQSGTPGLPTFGAPGTDFPGARAGQVLAPETAEYQNWQLRPQTVYFLAPGVHYGSFSANTGDVFVGGYADGVASVLDGQYSRRTAIDSNISIGEQTDVTIRYLTIQRFTPPVDQTAVNQTGAGGWKLVEQHGHHERPGRGDVRCHRQRPQGQLPDAERPVRVPVGADDPRRLADGWSVQRLGRAQRDQLQRHL
ncbi:hypothetical protein [Nostocoides sp. HKS02]|uniref:hypothetical protein n=1 Tax=Nostocoides sp. HKS02 TaxID=1813880 RepID=UPI0012B4F2A3|nr:hypothetical protein [Tetrasphaera sp. HKS02]QGN59139.1 hypothetical protein GKE56_15980 [Tetrasphaera sp. HKS02]